MVGRAEIMALMSNKTSRYPRISEMTEVETNYGNPSAGWISFNRLGE